MKFKKFKKVLSKSIPVQIGLKSTGDIDNIFQSTKDISEKYDEFSVIYVGIDHIIGLSTNAQPAFSVYLDDTEKKEKEYKNKEGMNK